MKSILATTFLFFFLVTGKIASSQLKIDKNEFRDAFLQIFTASDSSFESIATSAKSNGRKGTKITLPAADKCFISTYGYTAVYFFTDSTQCYASFRLIKDLLTYTAGAYNAGIRFVPVDKSNYHTNFYITDSIGFFESSNFLSITRDFTEVPGLETEGLGDDIYSSIEDKVKKAGSERKKTYIIYLHHDNNPGYAYFVSGSGLKVDTAISRIIREAGLGKDVQLKKFRTDKKITEGDFAVAYVGKNGVAGYDPVVIEEYVYAAEATEYTLRLTRQFLESEEIFMKRVETLLDNVRSALTESYCYSIDESSINFYKHPFAKEISPAIIRIQYGRDPGKPNALNLALYITRRIKK
jgi:hypothetical protein